MATNAEMGRAGEEAAASYLTTVGLRILDRNWRCRHGEVDIIGVDGDTVVFVEVKTRSGDGYGTPAEAVTPAKAQRIHRLAGLWLAERSGPWVPVRFDVVEVVIADGRGPLLSHLRAAF
ncbi:MULTISPECIES: YraN family protein [unclassified Rhodococcus (in: high G+C Gram-positive bacteria)]|jgi:putative endonuclease|uniref:YraN family protein n=1 Tax=unclassified Rhodococcus (in: high G+C Gram-positive bacteria) TaxID=192944 RepID=UPI00048785FE|nr:MULTISPECIES: YraN family protein [unclassified Rhodococcus (in: high G+C Gram-positive bacteria)]KQU34816.1 hypothetical protein ASG69_02570 [Rhodococcus sp. Leaf225]KQU45580.1 hypothetical protein ASH03_10120 [Rhodococcus sp. Leaf258]MBY6675812.1 YraN family protein [Rhodococcus sp. BP-332]MBY6705681.1 YraN family protein [Rhodococcus sp. BP-241]MDQ1201380.1 putative endonuclease [Rhodococcus sp. SORGH_AS_0303]